MSASAVLKLQKVGFSAEQVEALADFMDTQAASKSDLEAGISSVKADIASARYDAKIDNANLETRLVRWVVGTGVAAVLAIVTVMKYMLAGH